MIHRGLAAGSEGWIDETPKNQPRRGGFCLQHAQFRRVLRCMLLSDFWHVKCLGRNRNSKEPTTKMKTLIPFALVALTAVLAGCSAGSADDNSDTSDDAIRSASHPAAFVGSWDAEKDATLLFYSYSFKSDGTYSARGGCKPAATGPHCFAITSQSGTWKVQKS